MDQRIKRLNNIAVICGIVIIIGFFWFPVMKLRGTFWNESFAGFLESSGSQDVRNIGAWRFLHSFFNDVEPKYYDSIAQFYGYKNAIEVFLLFGLPVVGGIGLIVSGLTGSRTGIIISGIISAVSYLMQIITFPENMSQAYEYSFWQYLLLAVAILGIVTGFLGSSSENQSIITAQSQEHSPQDDSVMDGTWKKQGALIGLDGEYKDATIPIHPGERIILGRDPESCNLIFQDNAVSRVHCYIQYDEQKEEYIVIDVSTFGVFDSFDKPIERNVEVRIKPGKRIQIGKTNEVFVLE